MPMVDRGGSATHAGDHFTGRGDTTSTDGSGSGLRDGLLKDIQSVKSVNRVVTVGINCIESSTTGLTILRWKERVL